MGVVLSEWHSGKVETLVGGSSLKIRPYEPNDAAATLKIFLDAVTRTAAADYSTEQIRAWANADSRNLDEWDRGMCSRESYLATVDQRPSGFTDLDASGYIHMLFVAPENSRQGVGLGLLAHVELLARRRNIEQLSTRQHYRATAFSEVWLCHHGGTDACSWRHRLEKLRHDQSGPIKTRFSSL